MSNLRRVEGYGPKNADIVIIGEAPKAEDEAIGIPFSGNDGKLLTQLLLKAGIDRTKCYITNVVKIRPPADDLKNLTKISLHLEDFYSELYSEIESIKPKVILSLGAEPLKALTGLEGIQKYRGSVLSWNGIPVIPTFHPAYCLRDWPSTYISVFDMKKVHSIKPPMTRTYIINPTFEEIMQELDELSHKDFICIDLETFIQIPVIKMVGLGYSSNRAFCIPLVKGLTPIWSPTQEEAILTELRALLSNPNIKFIAQNAKFEMTQLFNIANLKIWMDTMRSHAILYPEFPHGLDFITSIYTDMIYYKDDGKASAESNFDAHQIYNCKDVVATFEAAMKMEEELKESGLHKFYHEYDIPLMHLLHKMEMRGVCIDKDKLESFNVRIDSEIEILKIKLKELTGTDLNPKSPKQLKKFLYVTLALPKKYQRGTDTLTTDERALQELYSKSQNPALKVLIELRQKMTLKSNFLSMKLSKDGRIRTSYGLTETGRLSSSKNIFKEGANLQNIPKRKGKWVREIFIPTPGKVLFKADLSQADARVVAWLGKDDLLKNLFKTGGDIHKKVASIVFRTELNEVTKKERDLAKNMVHGANYGVGPVTFGISMGIPKKEATYILEEVHKTFPNIRGVYHTETKAHLSKNRTLITPFGRKRTFLSHWGEDLFRVAFAYRPQSTVGDYINHIMLDFEKSKPEGAEILIQVHDEVVGECYAKDVELVRSLIKKAADIKLIVEGDVLTIPIEIEFGPNWGETE